MKMETNQIVERLDILISLMTPPYQKEKYSIGHDVLPYCDGSNTINDIVKKSKKSDVSVRKALERLRANGFIKSILKDSKTYYIRII
jgi:aminopeptidase-like protein